MSEHKGNRIIVVGGGLAGLMSALRTVEAGLDVDLFSLVPVKRSHSVCAQGGINAAKNTMGEGDSPHRHFDDTVYSGEFLANQPPVKEMTDRAPQIVDLLDRMGVPFNRTPEGFLDFRRFGGTLYHRTAYAGATTGQQMLYALDEQVRRWESVGRVRKFEFFDLLAIVLDDAGVCRGIVAQDLHSMAIHPYAADAVILATGGCGMIFGKSTNSTLCTGAAAARAHMAGAHFANGEFIQVHPTSIPGADKLRLMSESARGEGGRVWVPRDPNDRRTPQDIPESDRWFFLEERYPTYGNLVPRDVGTREIFQVCREGRGIGGRMEVYLDVTHLDSDFLDRKLGGILEIYEKFVGDDPRRVPMRVFPGVHYSMGGLWVDYVRDDASGGLRLGEPANLMTNVPGLYAVGEANYQYHGANRLGANSLLNCLFDGLVVGASASAYLTGLKRRGDSWAEPLFKAEVVRQIERQRQLLGRDGAENPYRLWRELGEVMTRNVTVVRDNAELLATEGKLLDLQERLARAAVPDKVGWANSSLAFARGLEDMLVLARVITVGALLRDECRGAHYKPRFALPDLDVAVASGDRAKVRDACEAFRDRDRQWLKTTVARFQSRPQRAAFSFEPVDVSQIPPRPRVYGLKDGHLLDDVWAEVAGQRAGAADGLTQG